MTALLFPGQGSQRRGMGKELFDTIPEYASAEKDVDAILGYSLRRMCLEDPGNQLKQTQITQPAIYVVNALHYYKAMRQGVKPAYVAGHSLGEYNALHAAGAFDFLTGLRLVKKRGELMSQAKSGGMAAVIGLSGEAVTQVIRDHGLKTLDVANYNSPTQLVVSGPLADIERAGPYFERRGAKLYMPLWVSAAFHSRYMGGAARIFAEFVSSMSFSAPCIPVMANVTGRPYPAEDASDKIKHLLAAQIDHAVRWTRCVRYLMNAGVHQFLEVGSGDTLTKTVREMQQCVAAAAA